MWWIVIALVALLCYVFFLITKAAVKAAIRELEAEKAALETEMSSGTLSTEELIAKSERIAALIEEIDAKSMRWLELSEL